MAEQKDWGQTDRYNSGPFECKEWLRIVAGWTSHKWFACLLTMGVWKYLWRAPFKNGVEDLKKAKIYMQEINACTNPQNCITIPTDTANKIVIRYVKEYFASDHFEEYQPEMTQMVQMLLGGTCDKTGFKVCQNYIDRIVDRIEGEQDG